MTNTPAGSRLLRTNTKQKLNDFQQILDRMEQKKDVVARPTKKTLTITLSKNLKISRNSHEDNTSSKMLTSIQSENPNQRK